MSSTPTDKLVRNRLLKSLPPNERRRIARELEIVELPRRDSIAETGRQMPHVYFPETCMISVVSATSDGSLVEVGVIGRNGMAALPVFLKSVEGGLESFVQIPGTAGRLSAESFRQLAVPGTALHDLSLRYTHYFLQQVARSAACNALHRLEQRCARWLLLASEEVGSTEFSLTHEFLSEMLGVRRASITDVASEFSERGLVKYRRGRVRIADPVGLRKTSCDCFESILEELERLFRDTRTRKKK